MIANSFPSTSEWALAAETAFVLLEDGSGRILNLEGSFYALTPTAARMLSEALSLDTAQAAQHIVDTYGIAPGRARGDLTSFLDGLHSQKLIQRNYPALTRGGANPSRWLLRIMKYNDLLSRSTESRCWALLALAYIAIRRIGWPRTVATFRAFHEAAATDSVPAPSVEAIAAVVRSVTAGHLLPVNCKERSLTCWSLLKATGRSARLVIGVDFYPFASHCWCETDGNVVADFADRCEMYRPVFIYD
jgi:hypothetical protein